MVWLRASTSAKKTYAKTTVTKPENRSKIIRAFKRIVRAFLHGSRPSTNREIRVKGRLEKRLNHPTNARPREKSTILYHRKVIIPAPAAHDEKAEKNSPKYHKTKKPTHLIR